MASLTSTTETASVVGITSNTMFDPAFIAGLTNTFDGTKASLTFTRNLPKIRLVDELDSTDFIVVCNKKADLTFTWQVSNVQNFPSASTTTLSNGDVKGFDIVTITSVVAKGMSTLSLSKISDAYISKFFHCIVAFANGGEASFTDATCDTTDTSVIVTCNSSSTIAIGQTVTGTGIPSSSLVETVSFTITAISDTTPTPSAAWQASQSHSAFAQTSTSGSGTGATFSVVTDGAGNPTFTLVAGGTIGYQIADTLVFTDPGSTSNTATVTVSTVSATVISFTVTIAATVTNTNETLTFLGATKNSDPCLLEINTGGPNVNDSTVIPDIWLPPEGLR